MSHRLVGITRRCVSAGISGISHTSFLRSQPVLGPLSSSSFKSSSNSQASGACQRSGSVRQFRSSSASLKEKTDFYKILGVSKRATKDEIKKNYRELAKKYHPDLNKNDKNAEKKFQEVSEAHEILTSDDKREAYDAYGHAGVDPNFQQGNPFGGGGGNPFGGGGFGGFNGQAINVEDIFEMFSEQMGGGMEGPGKDVETRLKITFMEAVKGCTRDISYDYFVRQAQGGSGRNRKYQKVKKSKKVSVTIPPGVNNGMQMRLESKGAEGTNGYPAGDLFIHLEVGTDAYFTRENSNIYVTATIPFTEAILGGVVDIRTLDGTVSMKIPAGTQPGAQLLLRGKGVENYATRRKGDQIVTINVSIPKKITPEQKRLIEMFEGKQTEEGGGGASSSSFAADGADETGSDSSSKANIWDKLKDFVGSDKEGGKEGDTKKTTAKE